GATPSTSRRVRRLKTTSCMALDARAKALNHHDVDVVAMNEGEPDLQPTEHVLAAAHEAVRLGKTKYTPSQGTVELREAVAAKFQRENGLAYDADQVMVSNGGKQVLYNGFLAVLDPGDEVVIIAPYWVSYPAQVRLAGGVPVVVRTRPED